MKQSPLWISIGAAALALLAEPNISHAKSKFVLEIADPPGVGFNDSTPATPVGGNTGKTLGDQRRIAFEYALGLWAKALDSAVPIRVRASFAPLPCSNGHAVLGRASSTGIQTGLPGYPENMWFPEALADRIMGEDLEPSEPDIDANFNGALSECMNMDWYYGLDARGDVENEPHRSDLVSTVLHEVAHGLGFSGFVRPETGEYETSLGPDPEASDPFTVHLFDLTSQKHWHEMTGPERVSSARNVRGLVWDGKFASEAGSKWLTAGAPQIKTTPALDSLRGDLVDANFGKRLSSGTFNGSLALAEVSAECQFIQPVRDLIVLTSGSSCHPATLAFEADRGGARGLLVGVAEAPPRNIDVPSYWAAKYTINIPVLAVSQADVDRLKGANITNLELIADPKRRIGHDKDGRVYMYASDPISSGSTASHFDPGTRPDPIMEPSASVNVHHDLVLETALLRDIGWEPFCGNNKLDADEQCDNGSKNSDTTPGACRTDCRRAYCGDSVKDPGEECDPGETPSATCSASCKKPECGDGTVDANEQCDDGGKNSDSEPNACRTKCVKASCGDGVVDTNEQCDDALDPSGCSKCKPKSKGSAGSGNAEPGDGSSAGKADDAGCSCRVGTGGAPQAGLFGMLLALSLLMRRRKRASALLE